MPGQNHKNLNCRGAPARAPSTGGGRLGSPLRKIAIWLRLGMKRLPASTWLLAVLLILSASSALAAATPPQITIVFRYDDYSSRSATDLEKQILAAFKRSKVCCTFSIIPFVKAVNYLDVSPQEVLPLNAAKTGMARQAIAAGIMDPAQHGYSHEREGYTHGWYTAYEGLDYDSQMYKINKGQEFLEKQLGMQITTFVPPYNSYDAITLKVLEKLHFKCLSASLRGQTVPFTPLKFLPETCSLAQLRQVIRYARKSIAYHPIICVMFHQYDFVGMEGYTTEDEKVSNKITVNEFTQLLSWITSQDDLRVRSISQLLQENVDLSQERFINNKYYLALVHLKPAWWPPHYGFYLPTGTAYNIRARNIFSNFTIPRLKNIMYIGAFYLIILIAFFIITYLLTLISFNLLGIIDKIFQYLSLIILCGLALYVIFAAKIEHKRLEILVGALGISLGVWLSGLRWKKSRAARSRY